MTDESAPETTAKATGETPRKGGPPRDWAIRFLRELSKTFNVRYSCDKAGVGKDTVYRRRARDPAFAKRWDQAYEEARRRMVVDLEQAFLDRAINGTPEPIFFKDTQVGTRIVHNATREIFALKSLGSDLYRHESVDSASDLERAASIRGHLAASDAIIPADPEDAEEPVADAAEQDAGS